MPTKSTFNHYNLTGHNASKKTTNVSQFFGVEYLNSQLETKDYHATDIKNIVYKDKTNQKRSGYEQVAKAPYNVNGYYEFYDESGNFHQIMHIGTGLYEVTDLEKGSHYWETKFNLISVNMANHKSMAFSSKGILYILDGTKYRYLRLNNSSLVLNNVVGSDIVYIPTTSLLNSDGTITAYEDVNILTNLRKNRINDFKKITINHTLFVNPVIKEIIQSGVSVDNYNDFNVDLYSSSTLDGKRQRVQDGSVDVTIDAKSNGEGQVPSNYYLWFKHDTTWSEPIKISSENVGVVGISNKNNFYLDNDLSWVQTNELANYFVQKSCLTINGVDYIPIHSSGRAFYFNDSQSKRIAEIYYEKGSPILKIYNSDLFNDTENDITITFPSSSTVENVDTINNCTFGIIYNDRLFVSGNPNNKNTDWHTQPITNYGNDETYGEFTYFSDLDYCNYGSDNTSVVGYDIFSDGNLIVFKEPSRFEPTIYRRYKELKVATSYTGEVVENQGTELYEEGYPCFPINTMGGECGIKNRSITNFLGNTLVLTKSGLKKLYTRQNTYNNERILVDVSSNINLAIAKEDLSNAFLFTFKDRLILQIGDITYVAYDSLKEDNEYEWYKLEGIKADIFFEIDNELYFSDIDGNICRFNDGEYVFKDRDIIYTALGATLPNDNEITINSNYRDKVSDGDKVLVVEHFSNNTERPIYYKIGDFSASNTELTGMIVQSKIVLNDFNDNFYDGLEIYINGSNISGVYKLERVEDGSELEFYVKGSNGYINVSNYSFLSIYVSTGKKQLVVANYDSENLTFNLKNELGQNVVFYTGETVQSYYCIIIDENNVEAYYKTKPYDMGSIGYDKTIWQYTIANDTSLSSTTNLGYFASRKQGKDAKHLFEKGNQELNFNAYSFNRISFLNNELPHIYTKYRMIPNVSFIRFVFLNDVETNMVLSQLSFVYTISGQTRGNK